MNGKKYNKILIIRTGAIGDVVHTSALFHSIKKHYKDVKIHYLTSELIRPLIENDPDLEKVLSINPKFNFFSAETKDYINKIKLENYDLAINLQPSLKIKFMLFLAGIKKQYIYKKTFKIHAVTNFWQTGLKAFPEIMPEKNLKLYLNEQTISNAKERLKNFPRPFVIINAGGVFSKRQGRTYPIEKWVKLGEEIYNKYGGTVILNGAKEDKEILSVLSRIPGSVNFIGELELIDSCAIISQADLMISGDSGPLHIATAFGVNSIGLYGSMPVLRTGCYSNGINITSTKDCVPCNRRKCKYLRNSDELYAPCMDEIPTEKIMETVNKLI